MGFKQASQKGNQVSIVTDHDTSFLVTGKLVGYTHRLVYVANGQFIHVYTDDGQKFRTTGKTLSFSKGEPIMYGHNIGIKVGNVVTVLNEKGDTIKIINANDDNNKK